MTGSLKKYHSLQTSEEKTEVEFETDGYYYPLRIISR